MTLVVEKEALPLSRYVCNALDVTFDLKIRLESVIKVDENLCVSPSNNSYSRSPYPSRYGHRVRMRNLQSKSCYQIT